MADPIVVKDTSQKPPAVPSGVDVPACDVNDPAQLAAWYGAFGWADHFRKVVLANCREAIRAGMAMQDLKVTEARLDDLSHVHPSYFAFLTTHLLGRVAYEREVLKRGLGG